MFGNCDEFLYLRTETNNLHTKWCQNSYGKESIDLNTYGKSTGHSGSYSTNYQSTGRELLMADEVRMLDNDKAILLIRGEKAIIDFKYDIMKHSNVSDTTDGIGKIYEHGKVDKATATISQVDLEDLQEIENIKDTKELEKISTNYELLSEEDIENYIDREEYENERKQENRDEKESN